MHQYRLNKKFQVFLLLFWWFNTVSASCVDSLYKRFDSISNVLNTTEKRVELNRIFSLCSEGSEAYYQRLGQIMEQLSRNDSALFYYEKALAALNKTKYPASWASIMANIGNVYYNLGNYEKALSYYNTEVENRLDNPKFVEVLLTIYLNKASTLRSMGELEKAALYSDKIDVLIDKYKIQNDLQYYSCLKGDIYLSQNKFNEASREYRISIMYADQVNDNYAAGVSASNASLSYAALKMFDSAMYYVKESVRYGLLNQNNNAMADIYYTAADVSEQCNKIDTALIYMKLYLAYKDSNLNEIILNKVAENELKIQDQISFKNLEVKTAELATSRTRLIFSLISVGLLIAITLIAIRSRQQTKKLTTQELNLKTKTISDLLQKQEINTVNSMLKGQDGERQRIAQDLHDRLGSLLSLVKLNFSSLKGDLEKIQERSEKSFKQTNDLIDEAVDEVRKISHDLSMGAVTKFGLKTALLQLGQAIEANDNIKVKFIFNNLPDKLFDEIQINIYRIAQELISNTLKYANAKEIEFQILNENDSILNITYEDDGIGFELQSLKISKGIGFQNIESRVKNLKGDFHLDSRPGNGFSFFLSIPISPSDIK